MYKYVYVSLQIHLSFLFVGHTHEDIDAKFSRIAEELRQHHAETLPKMKTLIPNCKEISFIYDVKGWLENRIVDVRKHTTPLHYKFVSDDQATVTVYYKHRFCLPWRVLPGGCMFVQDIHGKVHLPTNSPTLTLPDFDKNVKPHNLLKCLKHWAVILDDAEDREWWTKFVQYLLDVNGSDEKKKGYAKFNAKWILPSLPRQPMRIPQIDEVSAIPESLHRLLNAEIAEVEV